MKRLMIVEDEAVIAMQLGMRLRAMGYDVVGTATSAEESVRMAKDLSPGLILMDIVMEGDLDGIDAAELIKAEMGTPIIFLTAYTDDEYINRAKSVGPFGYIVKPYSDNEVKANIEIAFHKNKLEQNQKLAEERIRRLFLSVEQNPWMIMIMNSKGEVEFVNNKFLSITGYKPKEIVGKNFSLLVFDEMSPEVYKEIWEKVSAGEEWKGKLCIRKKKGEPYQECTTIISVKNANGSINCIVLVMDSAIEHDKRKQMLLLQSERLDAMRVMTAGIAHEFNNIFAVISGNVQLMKDSCQDDEGIEEGLNIIKRVVVKGSEFIQGMNEFANTKVDTAEYFYFNIGKLIKQALDSTMHVWKDAAQARGISYNIDGEDIKELPAVFGNPSEIKEALVSIINNALEAMPDGGRLSFSTWSRGKTVFVSISDTGKGMTAVANDRIFDPFFTTRSPEGVGLGMSAAYSITIRNGGRISVESKPGKGTMVTIRLGMTKEIDNPVILSESMQETKVGRGRILVLEDDETICKILNTVLSEEGYIVKIVNNGVGAIKLLENETFDLLLCDQGLTTVPEFDFIKSIDALEKRPKIGLITGSEDESVIKKNKKDLKASFIARKPFDFSALVKYINEVFDAG